MSDNLKGTDFKVKVVPTEKYNVGIIGTGRSPHSFGWYSAGLLANQNWIDKLYLHNKTTDVEKKRKTIVAERLKKELNKFSELEIIVSDLNEIKNNTDLSIIAIEANRGLRKELDDIDTEFPDYIPLDRLPHRTQLLAGNFDPIVKLAKSFSGYDGNVLIVTNPVDILSYVFCAYSKLPTSKIIGFSYIDSLRFADQLREYRKREEHVEKPTIQNAFVIGGHDNTMIPVFSQAYIDNRPSLKYDLIKQNKDNITKNVKLYGTEVLVRLKSTVTAASPALVDVIKSIFDVPGSKQEITSSVYSKEGIFIGYPFFTHDKKVFNDLVFTLNPEEEAGFHKAVQTQLKLKEDLENCELKDKEGNILPLKLEERIEEYQVKNLEKLEIDKKTKTIEIELTNGELFEEKKEIFVPSIYISTGNQHEVLETKLGDFRGFKPVFRSHIKDGEHFAGPIKIAKYRDMDYLLLGTSQGIISYQLNNQEKSEFLINDGELTKGYVIWSMELMDGNLLGTYSHGKEGKGVIAWNFRKPNKKGNIEYPEDVFKLKQTSTNKVIVTQLNKLVQLELPKYRASNYYVHDDIITALNVIDDYVVFGDTQGRVFSIDENKNRSKEIITNLAVLPVLDIDCFELNHKRYMITGDAHGMLSCYNLDSSEELFRIPIGRITTDDESRKRITTVKYYEEDRNKWIVMEVGNMLVQYDLRDLIGIDNPSKLNFYKYEYYAAEHGLQGLGIWSKNV